MTKYIDFNQLQIGDSLPLFTKESITKGQLVRYAGASDDFNPIHTDDDAAKKAGLEGVIAHGMLVMGVVGQAITKWTQKRYLKKFGVRFKGMTYPGDVITVTASVEKKESMDGELKVVCSIQAQDQNGHIKIEGQFQLAIAYTKGGIS
jgi:acyl dehydratase